ncbi:prepilin-type N-terminal cleavage/methylation domain-containing protein [Nocardioides sp.]|uniref:type II secretion system protein n=1 Tax=Nocardioides sp. TaxID=35761 RepID=UPI002EDB1809
MSPSADRRRDEGFTLVEIIVALGVIMTVMAAVLPQLLVGIRSGETSRLVTQTKGVAQGQLERMRNLPYHVSPEAGDYRDVLDYYFRNLATPGPITCTDADGLALPTTAWTGYVPADGARCSYEPQSGEMYRYVVPHPATGTDPLAGFQVVVDTQFLSAPKADGSSQVLAPPSGYNTQSAGHDSPVSSQIGVTVTVLYDRRGITRPVTTYTQIADQPASAKRIDLAATATAVDIGSITAANGAESLQAGLLDLAGSLTFASTATASLTAASAGLATGEQGAGASTTVAAPSAVGIVPAPAGGIDGTCGLACWGASQLDLGPVSATDGLPNVGSAANPMQARLTDLTNLGLSFESGAASEYRPGLDLSGPLARLDAAATATASGVTATCAPSGTGAPAFVRASGFLHTTPMSDATPTAEACAASSASTISLFPTSFAPDGVLQVELVRATARCVVSGADHVAQTPTFDYRAVVRRHVPPATPDDTDGYVDVLAITPALSADDLAAIDPATLDVGGGHTLGDYVASWSALVPGTIEPTAANGRSAVSLSGVLKITSQPVRLLPDDTVDPASAVSVTLGQVGCTALDAR